MREKMRKSLLVCAVLWITVELVICGNIVLQDKQRKNNIVMTDDNIVMKGDFFGGEHCEDTHTVEHVWLPMPHHHHHWGHWQHGGQESRQMLNYALPERRMSEQQQLSRLILMLASQAPPVQRPANAMPIIEYQSIEKASPQPHNIQQKIQQRSGVDLASREERIDWAFEKHLNKVTNEIARD